MATNRILLFTGFQLTAHLWRNGQVNVERKFFPTADEPDGLKAFAAYLNQHSTSHFYWLTDVPEESFQLEKIPHVQGRDRTALITRRLKQYFYNTPFTTALSLGRSNEGRRDEKVLLVALTRPDAINTWLDVIRQNSTILAGIYSVPLILAECAPRWLNSKQPTLLINHTNHGIRQSFFYQGKLQFSRLTPFANIAAPGTSIADIEIAREIASESTKTYQYLLGQRQLSPKDPVRVVVLIAAKLKSIVQAQCPNLELLKYDFLDLETITQREKLKSQRNILTSDQLLIHWLITHTPAQQFAPPAERHFYRLAQIRLALTAIAFITLASGLLFTIKTAFDTAQLQQETRRAQSQTMLTTQRYNALLDSLPKTNITPENLRALMIRYESLQKRTAELTPLLMHLSHALDAMPQVELVSLDWKIETTLNAALSNAQKTFSPSLIGADDTAQNASANININNGPWVTLRIQGRLPLGLAENLRAQKQIIDTFAQKLENPQTRVQLLTMPFDIESNKSLKITQETSDAHNEAAPTFSLMIARPL
jgi:hypothetical protein